MPGTGARLTRSSCVANCHVRQTEVTSCTTRAISNFTCWRSRSGMISFRQPIYCRDGLVGFTEPLGFESFEDALEAYTESQTETHDTLRNPLPKPDFSKLRETHTTMKPVQLLKRLRDTHGLLGQRIDELVNVEGCIERLEQEIEEKSKSTEAYGVLIKVVSKQLEKTNELTSSSSDRLDEINNNCTALTKRLEGLRQEQTAIERERTSLMTERNEQSKLSTRCLDGIRDLENEIQKIKDDIIEFSLYENCMDTMMLFIDHLLASDVTEFAQKVEEYKHIAGTLPAAFGGPLTGMFTLGAFVSMGEFP
ncbi:phosphatidylinositol 3-kinase regulatory subunit gamma-like [Dreissena polymorpha]|uniref:phosphatidylinositol 3-kinase regulatory subunit gamma-like n=1 Tax=Dreissena polymorpha TaxID=45954 RepID=UPI002264DDE3|nr:phosphatidylinositol 3-kinase regulatory subunit gamma-like [Dreissena polymorpha]